MALIAVIDDDHDILDASSLVLTAKGYEVVTADNPDDGYKIVKEKKPDLIILDVMMNEPDDGFFLAQKFRREKLEIPIIMYTSVSKALGAGILPQERWFRWMILLKNRYLLTP